MIIGLLALSYILFGGGHQTFLLNPALKKNVETYVKNSKRRDDIYQLIKQTDKNEAVFLKETKSVFDKKLVSLNKDTSSTKADFIQEYNKFYDSLGVLQNKYVDDEIKIRSFILPNEWDSIMKKVLVQPDQTKIRKNLMEENQKLSRNLQAACNKNITDPSSKKQAAVLVEGYNVKGDSVATAFLDLNYKYNSAIRPYKVSRLDFEPLQSKMIGLRKDYSDYLIDMRFKLKAITPNKRWYDLAKVLNNNFVYQGAGISK